MATLLEGSNLLNYFLPVFVFILVVAITWGIIGKFKLFGSPLIRGFIAVMLGLLFIIVPKARELISFMTPWFVIFLIIIFFLLLVFMFMGVNEDSLYRLIHTNAAVITIVFIVIGVILLVAITKVFGPIFAYPAATATGFWDNFKRAFFSAKLLGVIFLLFVAAKLIQMISMDK